MTRDEIIRMAKESDATISLFNGRFTMYVDELERFAALVAEHERSECAKVCDSLRPSERYMDQRYYDAAEDCAAVIRARG